MQLYETHLSHELFKYSFVKIESESPCSNSVFWGQQGLTRDSSTARRKIKLIGTA